MIESLIMLMSVAQDRTGDKNVSVSVSNEFADEFDRALMKAAMSDEYEIGLNTSRAEALRILMKAAIDDPSLFSVDEG